MYELKNGSARLANALLNVQDDDYTINRLAQLLHYLPEQLREDIQAINNYVSANLQRDKSD